MINNNESAIESFCIHSERSVQYAWFFDPVCTVGAGVRGRRGQSRLAQVRPFALRNRKIRPVWRANRRDRLSSQNVIFKLVEPTSRKHHTVSSSSVGRTEDDRMALSASNAAVCGLQSRAVENSRDIFFFQENCFWLWPIRSRALWDRITI